MSDIAFSMTADEKDVIRGIQAVGKESGKLRDQIASLVTQSKDAGVADQQLARTRLAALDPILAKQKELKASGDALKKQLSEGKISADEYKTSFETLSKESNDLRVKLQQLQAQVAEDTADLKKAGTIIGQTEDKTAKYARAVAELDRMKAKGILTSKQHAAAIQAETDKLNGIGDGADKSGGLIGGLTTKMAGFVGGLASASAIIAVIKSEYDALIERQGKSADVNISLAAEQEALLMNLGGADAGQVTGDIRKLSKDSGIKEENVTRTVNEAMAARGDLGVDAVVKAVGSVSKIRKFAPAEMAGLAAATVDTQKQTGLGTDESLGFLLQMQGQARTKNLKGLAENFTPAVGGIMSMGTDRQTAGALLASLSHGMGDTTGAMSATSGIQLAKQLREYGRGGGPELQAQLADLGKTHETQTATLNAEYDKKGIALNAQEMPSEKKAELRRQLAEEEKAKKAALKESQANEVAKVESAAPAVPIADVLKRMQNDREYRETFLKGKDKGGFGATFEAKALPAIESLLSGGTQAKQFDAAKSALSEDPTKALNDAIKARGASQSIGIAEVDQRMSNVSDQLRIDDKAGAVSSIMRDGLREIRDSMGKTSISSNLDTVINDVTTGGMQDEGTAIKSLEALRTGLRPRRQRVWDDLQKEETFDFNKPADKERFNSMAKERYGKTAEGKQEALLTALIDEIKGMRDDQKEGKHAGVVANRAAGEGRP